MTAVVRMENRAPVSLALPEREMLDVLKSSLYPGAQDASVLMVLQYCKAANLDPMQKPVHIVPMWDNKAKAMRDVIMPGVNLYRTQAARTGAFAGMSEPEFGPMLSENIGGANITFPEWCRVSVQRRLATGELATFTAVEYWIENYAVKGGQEKSIAPNAMWMKRPRGQLAKCASAQALRAAFPESSGPPTAEEMEGKTLLAEDVAVIEHATEVERKTAAEKPVYSDADFATKLPVWTNLIASGQKPAANVIATVNARFRMTDEQVRTLNNIKVVATAEAGVAE